MFAGQLALAFLAGLLSVLSPCVLPILPVAVGGAVSAHRFGPLALAAGLALSFTAIGLFLAALGASVGFVGSAFQSIAAALLVLIGAILVVPQAQSQLAAAASPVGDFFERKFGRSSMAGLSGQFGLGLLFGAVWSPCAGPTLGAAALMAASGHNSAQAAATMIAFSGGAVLPLLTLGTVSRAAFLRWRARIASTGRFAKALLGVVLILAGVAILTGAGHDAEAFLVAHSPDWLLRLTTQY
ncbi:MAG: cytochrome c biogenesis CcdA family protein [Alphaproteobacteria bacterium]|nr:cytochrome c biogenesis CcdA family protein [Alphaproteobacteria bacterium]MDE2495713.1 cytochrome c biogenesis protein CcdA [Alphaproteobacteria bacterium]